MPLSRFRLIAAAAVVTFVAVACGGGANAPASKGAAATGLLGAIEQRGVLRVSTDPAYPPQSSLNEETGQWEGFDIDVANEIGRRLGLEVEFVTPAWETIIAGHWQERWDISVGSMTVTPERAQVLHFATPYYYSPATVAVLDDDTSVQDVSTDLDGKTIGVCGGCTYESYLDKTLSIPGEQIDFVIDDADIRTYDTDTTAIQDLVLGRVDAVISSLTTLQEAEKKGKPIRLVDNVFFEPLAVAVDKSAEDDPMPLVNRLNQIVQQMHTDGTLSRLSMKWFGQDLTTKG